VSILVVGSVALDTVLTPLEEKIDLLGGSATYFAAAASYFAPVRIVGAVGEDFQMNQLEFLKERSVDLGGLQIRSGRTFRWTGRYGDDPNDRETIDLQYGVFAGFSPLLPDDYGASEYIFLANINPELQLRVLQQITAPKLIMADTIDHWIERRRGVLLEVLKGVHAVTLNDTEAKKLAGEDNLIRASKAILKMGPEIVIIKKGEHGALMVTGDSLFALPACPVENVCDPTGAGDSFAGGFMGYLHRTGDLTEESLRKAVACGTVMASFVVERFSVDGIRSLSQEDIERRLREFKGITWFEEVDPWG